MTDHIHITRNGPLTEILLSRPDKKNALTGAMYEAMIDAMAQAEKEDGIGAVLLSGAGGAFTAGNDIGDFLGAMKDRDGAPAFRFIKALAQFTKPFVAAVEGVAVGVGTTLILHCDLVYAAPSAQFRMPFVDLGLVPEAGASLLVPQRVGMVKATELLMLGTGFDGAEAVRLGLVNAIVPAESLLATARQNALTLANRPRAALLATRKLMRGDLSALMARIDEEADAFFKALQSDEARAAFMAFMMKGKGR